MFKSLSEFRRSAQFLRVTMNMWPPFLCSGIRVECIGADFRTVRVALLQRFYNRNYVGTHFGGSLFAMLDPFYMLMVLQNLGSRYYVWDRAGEIEFVSPGRGRVYAELSLSTEDLNKIIAATGNGEKYEPCFEAAILSEGGELVARYRKRLYVRLKPIYRPQ